MHQQNMSAIGNWLVGNLLIVVGKTCHSHRLLRTGQYLCQRGDAQMTMADARAVIQRSLRRGEAVAIARHPIGNGSAMSID